jgi:hypothetical protein
MTQGAQVTSIDALEEFRTALVKFGTEAQAALCAADIEIRRTLDGLDQQLRHWQTELRVRQEDVVRAKAELSRRKWGHRDGGGPGTTDQEIALAKAQQRLSEAEAKIVTIRRWQHLLPREVHEYEGPARGLASWLEANLRHTTAILASKIAALESYAALLPPGEEQARAAASEAPSSTEGRQAGTTEGRQAGPASAPPPAEKTQP